jgi:hypothetical protein
LIKFARQVVRRWPSQHRLARVASLLTFVGRLIDSRLPAGAGPTGHNGVDLLLAALGGHRGPAVVLAALLMALGERARVECTREMAFVQVELSAADLPRLPPFARVHLRGGRYFLPLDARRGRIPLGFLPQPVRTVLARRARVAPDGLPPAAARVGGSAA